MIINADLVDCIVAMPTQLFYTTQIPVSLWFLAKNKKQKGKTLFIDARKLGTKCVLQGKYAGRVTDVRHGVVFIRLNNGVNAVAHTCYDRRMPGKKDDVSFAVTRLDEERGIAVGIITRIIKQNL